MVEFSLMKLLYMVKFFPFLWVFQRKRIKNRRRGGKNAEKRINLNSILYKPLNHPLIKFGTSLLHFQLPPVQFMTAYSTFCACVGSLLALRLCLGMDWIGRSGLVLYQI
jgi:hypothetical protein